MNNEVINNLDLIWQIVDEYVEERYEQGKLTEDEGIEIYEALHRVRKAILKDE